MCVNFKKIRLKVSPSYCKTKGEYVVFYYDHVNTELELEGVVHNCENYDCLDLKSFRNPIFALHRKYIHEVTTTSNILCKLNFEPIVSLELNMKYPESESESEKLIKYLSSASLQKWHTTLNFREKYDFSNYEDLTKAIFGSLNIKILNLNGSK